MNTTTKTILPFDYLVRPSFGASPKLVRMQTLTKIPAHEQLLSAILRQDRDEAIALLKQSSGKTFGEGFLADGAAGNICGLVCENIIGLDLADEFKEIKLTDGSSLTDRMIELTTTASTLYARNDCLFVELLTDLDDLNNNVIWLKGTTLSRTLYPCPHFRLSQDFDILVEPGKEKAVLDRLISTGFRPVWDDPGLCHQYGVGPAGSLDALSLSPSKEIESCHNLSLIRPDWPYLELKFDPLDRGLRTKDLDTFFEKVERIDWDNRSFQAPAPINHLLLCLTHFHKHGLQGWHWLYDIHLLSTKINEEKHSWAELVNRCVDEGIELSAWAGLDLARDRLGTKVPSEVIEELSPRQNKWLVNHLAFTINTEFLWNSASLPMLVFNMLFLGDSGRKGRVLGQIVFPSSTFLAKYYLNREQINWLIHPFILLLHWLILLLPGGVTRRTFGRFIWPRTQSETGRY